MKGIFRFLLVIIIITGPGCRQEPEGILPIDQLKVVFLHQMLAEEMVNNFIARDTAINFDSARTSIFSGVMKLHKTDSATFIRSVNYYKADPERFAALLDSVNALATREKEYRDKKAAAALRKKAIADSIAVVDSLAKLKRKTGNNKDSLGKLTDSANLKKKVSTPPKDTVAKRKK